MKHEIWELHQKQALPLAGKVTLTKERIRQWVEYYGIDGVYVSFSGGKDSTVLLSIAREMYPDIKAAFVDTGLEYPEIRQFVKTWDNVDWLKPKMNFRQVIEKYGYPMISKEVAETVHGARKYLKNIGGGDKRYYYFYDKLCGLGKYAGNVGGGATESTEESEVLRSLIDNQRVQMLLGILRADGKATLETIPSKKDLSKFSQKKYQFFLKAPFEIDSQCCRVMKKNPAKRYQKETGRRPILAQLAEESRLRTQVWLREGCNAFDAKEPKSNPMSFWTESDVLMYLKLNHIPIATVYGDIVSENEVNGQIDLSSLGLFEKERPILKTTGCSRTGCVFCGFGCHLEKGEGRFERLKRTHPKLYEYIMKPWDEGGLGYKEVIDWTNENGNLHIKY